MAAGRMHVYAGLDEMGVCPTCSSAGRTGVGVLAHVISEGMHRSKHYHTRTEIITSHGRASVLDWGSGRKDTYAPAIPVDSANIPHQAEALKRRST